MTINGHELHYNPGISSGFQVCAKCHDIFRSLDDPRIKEKPCDAK